MNLVLVGPPGSGKGTQAELLCRARGLEHFSTGDVLRAAVADGSPLGRRVGDFLRLGKLVPDDLVRAVALDFVDKKGARGMVFDGYPRTLTQARDLDEILKVHTAPLTKVLVLDLSGEEVVRRLSARAICTQCGQVYNRNTRPPKKEGFCDLCSSALRERSDDEPLTIRQRLEVYEHETRPLLDYYAPRGILSRIPGEGTVAEVQRRIQDSL